jgi:sulfatase maturation enzyme AslB (radical SAM superfamily)
MAGAKEYGWDMPVNMELLNFTRFKEPSSIRNVALVLTCRCPLSCRYCFLDRTQPDMPEDVLKKSIDLLFTSPEDKIELQFFGGEPLLRFDLIKKALYYAGKKKKATGKNFEYLLTTNGLLLDEEKTRLLSREKVQVMLSIDGGRLTQLKNRPMSAGNDDYFNTLLRAIALLNKYKTPYFVNMVVLREDIAALRKNIDFLRSKGVRHIWVAYALGQAYVPGDVLAYIKELGSLFKSAHGRSVRIMNFEIDCEPILYCPQVIIAASGKIYIGCALVLEKAYPELNRIFHVGKLDDFKDLAALKMTKSKQTAIIRRHSRLLDQKLLANIHMGIAGDSLYKFNHLRREYALFESHSRSAGIRAERYFSLRRISLCVVPERLRQRPNPCADSDPAMSETVLKKTIDMLFASLENRVELEFSGGEPLARFETVKAALLYAGVKKKSQPKQLTCTLVSHGKSFDVEKINFLSRQKVTYLLRISGGVSRGYLKRRVSGIIKLLKDHASDFGVMLDTPFLNLDGFEENISYLIGQGVRKIRFSYDPAVLYDASCVARALVSLFRISRRLYFHKAVTILNCGSTGARGAAFPDITVDPEGRMYLCGDLVFSRHFEKLREICFVGDVGRLRDRKDFSLDLDAALRGIMTTYARGPRRKEIVMNNLIIEEMLWEFFHSEMYFPLKRQGPGDTRCLI